MSAVAIPILPAVELKRILYTTDLSKASRTALPVVSAIARRYDSQVFVAYVSQGKQENERREFEGVLETKELTGITVTPVLERGEPAAKIRQITQDNQIHLAILSTHGRRGFKRVVMGSVAEEILRTLPCPVLTVGPHFSRRSDTQFEIKSIVFPTDLSTDSQAVLPYLAIVAAEYESDVQILHVLPKAAFRHPSASQEADILRTEMQRTFSPQFDPRCNVHFEIDSGDVCEQILARSRAWDADLIGLGVRQAGKLSTHFRDTVVYRIILESECPVLTAHFGDVQPVPFP